MDVSVILCTWNNCKRLGITLDAISRCVIPPNLKWELVLVNNNCTDETPRVAREFADKLPLVYVEEPQQGLSRAKNTGLMAASGKLIVFTDDDVKPCPEWIMTYWYAYQGKPSGFYFGGPLSCEYESDRPNGELLRVAPWPVIGLDWGPEVKELSPEQRFLGANWACPADALRGSGGFDIRLGLDASLGKRRVGEEFDLMERLRELGMSAWYLPQANVVHFVPRRKCGLEYFGSNAEAQGIHSVYSATIVPFLYYRPTLRSWCERRGLVIAGIPWRLYIKTVSLGVQWVWARLPGRKGYEEYISLRFCIGVMKGYRQSLREHP